MFDTHAHLTSLDETRDLKHLLDRAKNAGIVGIVNICIHPQELKEGIALSKEYNWIYNAAALTPHDAANPGWDDKLQEFKKLAAQTKLIAIGECGLDYHYDIPREQQKKVFQNQIKWADNLNLPLIIHCRKAFTDLFEILDENKVKEVLIHCFTGTQEEATMALDRGYFLGISGIVTFKNSQKLRDIVKNAPIEQLLLETDAPFLAPEGYRGNPNESSYLGSIAKVIAELKNSSIEEISKITTSNAYKFFNIK